MTATAVTCAAVRKMTREECETMLEQCRSRGICRGSVVFALHNRLRAIREWRANESSRNCNAKGRTV